MFDLTQSLNLVMFVIFGAMWALLAAMPLAYAVGSVSRKIEPEIETFRGGLVRVVKIIGLILTFRKGGLKTFVLTLLCLAFYFAGLAYFVTGIVYYA